MDSKEGGHLHAFFFLNDLFLLFLARPRRQLWYGNLSSLAIDERLRCASLHSEGWQSWEDGKEPTLLAQIRFARKLYLVE